MTTVLAITSPIFLLIAVGFICARIELFSQEGVRCMGVFVINLAVPALLLVSLAQTPLTTLYEPMFLCVYAIGGLTTYAIVFLLARIFLRRSLAESGYFGLGASLPNTIIVGYPILIQVFDAPPLNAFTMAVLTENIFLLPLAIFFLELGAINQTHQSLLGILKQIAKRVIVNPIMLSIIAGLSISLLGLKIPGFIENPAEILGKAVSGVSLIFIGATLANTKVGHFWSEVSVITLGKLVLHPVLIVTLVWLLPDFDPALTIAAIIFSTMPMFGIYPIVGSKYGYAPLGASALICATICSFISVSLALYFVL